MKYEQKTEKIMDYYQGAQGYQRTQGYPDYQFPEPQIARQNSDVKTQYFNVEELMGIIQALQSENYQLRDNQDQHVKTLKSRIAILQSQLNNRNERHNVKDDQLEALLKENKNLRLSLDHSRVEIKKSQVPKELLQVIVENKKLKADISDILHKLEVSSHIVDDMNVHVQYLENELLKAYDEIETFKNMYEFQNNKPGVHQPIEIKLPEERPEDQKEDIPAWVIELFKNSTPQSLRARFTILIFEAHDIKMVPGFIDYRTWNSKLNITEIGKQVGNYHREFQQGFNRINEQQQVQEFTKLWSQILSDQTERVKVLLESDETNFHPMFLDNNVRVLAKTQNLDIEHKNCAKCELPVCQKCGHDSFCKKILDTLSANYCHRGDCQRSINRPLCRRHPDCRNGRKCQFRHYELETDK